MKRDRRTPRQPKITVGYVRVSTEDQAQRAPSPLQELMAANDLKQKDVAPYIGSRGVTSEVLNGRRAISKTMAHKLGARFNVSHAIFL